MNETAKEFIQKLTNVKLVIGNGFDLYCKLPTRYDDYFNSKLALYNYMDEWYKKLDENLNNFFHSPTMKPFDIWPDFYRLDEVNVWDFFFFFNSKINNEDTKEKRWCDIECLMTSWFLINDGQNWSEVLEAIENNFCLLGMKRIVYAMGMVVYKKNNFNKFESEEQYYVFLLDQLKQFEKNFGEYIKSLHYYNNGFQLVEIHKTRKMNEYALNELCNIDNLTSIDSFNYDLIRCKKYEEITNNINGNWNAPIFGVDSKVCSSSDIRYIFSKTNRRIELGMNSNNVSIKNKFDNVIIFGHSLNEADYSYFFSIFDELQIVDATNNSKIVFAYNVYDENNKEIIKMSIRSAIYNLFREYAIYKGYNKQPNRLLDFLTIQGKILTYEIEDLNKIINSSKVHY